MKEFQENNATLTSLKSMKFPAFIAFFYTALPRAGGYRVVTLMHNPAVDLVPFGRWTLRDKAAQRRLALR